MFPPTASRLDGWRQRERLGMSDAPQEQLPLIERIERAMVVLALIIERDGDVYLPLFEKFESELEALRKQQATRERARALLKAYSREGDVKAISSRNLSLSSNEGPRPYLGL